MDRAIEMFGAAGVSDDTPLALLRGAGVSPIEDGPDAVHRHSVAGVGLGRASK